MIHSQSRAKIDEPSAPAFIIAFFCCFRLAKAYEELNEFLKAEEDLKETEEYTNAMAVIEEAKVQLP